MQPTLCNMAAPDRLKADLSPLWRSMVSGREYAINNCATSQGSPAKALWHQTFPAFTNPHGLVAPNLACLTPVAKGRQNQALDAITIVSTQIAPALVPVCMPAPVQVVHVYTLLSW